SGADSVNSISSIPAEEQRKSWRRGLLSALRVTACAYVMVLIVLLAFENALVYHPTRPNEDWSAPPDAGGQDIMLASKDNMPIHAWWWPLQGDSGVVLYCHGNAGNLSSRGPTIGKIRQALGESILIFDYPGYGKSGGSISDRGCYLAADAAYDWLVND